MFQEEVTTKDGHVKTVVASSEVELAEAVAAVKNDSLAASPDLHNPVVANAIVSPDSLHTEPAFVQPVDPDAVEVVEVKKEKKVTKKK